MLGALLTILKIIFILGFLIFIHEGGHFIVAKLCKIRVNEFAIGFGPVIFKKQGKETLFQLRLIPLGGFCNMEGEEERSEVEGSFSKASIPKRIAVAEVPGVAAMSGGFAGGISEVLSGKKNLSKGIKVEAGEKETKIDVNIIVEFGVRIPDVAFEIQNRVKKAVENMTGLKVVEVNVHVQGVNADTTLEKDNNDSKEEK